MLKFLKNRPQNPLRDAFLSMLVVIPIAYLVFFAGEIVTGHHRLDFQMLSNFLWLGVGIMAFAWFEDWSGGFKRSR